MHIINCTFSLLFCMAKNFHFLWRSALHLVSPVRQGAPQSDFICFFILARLVRHSSLQFLLAPRTSGKTGIFSDIAWNRKFKIIKSRILSKKVLHQRCFPAFPVSDQVTIHTNCNLAMGHWFFTGVTRNELTCTIRKVLPLGEGWLGCGNEGAYRNIKASASSLGLPHTATV